MIYLYNILLYLFLFQSVNASNQCGVSIKEYKTQTMFGKNIGFYVLFKNTSGKTVDAIEYNVDFKNGFDDLMETKNFIWQAGHIDLPVVSNATKWDIKKAWVDGANKITITIVRVHYTTGTSCISDE